MARLSTEYVALQTARAERNDAAKMAGDLAWSRVGVTPAERVEADTECYEQDARRDAGRHVGKL